MADLPERKTAHGHDAYCHVCWNAVFALWIEAQDPEGKCPHGHVAAHDCPDAMGRARLSGAIAKYKADAKTDASGEVS